MAGKRGKQPVVEPEELEPEEPEEGLEQEEASAQSEVEDEVESESELRARRTAKTRAPGRTAVAPVNRPRPARRGARGRPDPRQLSLFSRLAPERISQNVTKTGGSILISLVAIGVLIVLFHLFAGSKFFALKGVDVRGNLLLSNDEVETMVRSVVSRGVLNADLDQIRVKLESYPLIREAEVARLLPDRLRVIIVERQPVALARRGDSVVCVDDDGVMFGDISHWRGKTTPPVMTGLAEGGENVKEINHQLIMTYKRLMAELDQSEPPLSSRIDGIHFDEDRDVILTLADSRVTVRIGKEDFRTRLNAALDVLDAVRRKDAEALNVLRISDAERLLGGTRIAYLNATDPKRVIVGLDE